MNAPIIEDSLIDNWLQQKSQEILSKIDKEKFTTEDILVLTLKTQAEHFRHIHTGFREEFKKIDQRFEKIDQRFESIDQKFDRLHTVLFWGFGLILTSIIAVLILLK